MDSEMEVDYAADLSDDISLASSTESQRDKDFEVETILADRTRGGKQQYLVKWAGYHTLKATWEPSSSFNSPETIKQWRAKKLKIEKGQLPRFDTEKFKKSFEKATALHEAHQLEREAQARLSRERLESLLFQDDNNVELEPTDDLIAPPAETNVLPAAILEHRSARDSPLFVSEENVSSLATAGDSTLNTEDVVHDKAAESTAEAPQPSAQISAPAPAETPAQTPIQQPVPRSPPRSAPPVPPQIPQGLPKAKPTASKPPPPKPPVESSAISNFTAPQTARKSKWDVRSRETVPDANQLTLLKPSEFPARFGDSHAMTSSTDGVSSPLDTEKVPFPVSSRAGEPTSTVPPQAMGPPQRPSKAKAPERPRSPGPYSRRDSVRTSDNGRLGADRRPRSPGPYSRRDSARTSDNGRPEADRRPRSPGPYSRRESTTRDDGYDRLSSTRQADVYRPSSPGTNSQACGTQVLSGGDSYRPSSLAATSQAHGSQVPSGGDYYRPSSPAIASQARGSQVSSGGDSHRSMPRTHGQTSADNMIHPDRLTQVTTAAPASTRDPKAITVADQIARMPLGRQLAGVVNTSNGYFFNPGEVLAHILFGPQRKLVGAVRVCGMNPKAKLDMLASKAKRFQRFDMAFVGLCNVDEYGYLCDQGTQAGFNNMMWCNAWMEGFEDTNENLFHMADYLRENNLLAIYYPAEQGGNVWLAYSPKCPDFDFLDHDHLAVPDGVPIRLAVRSPLLPLNILSARPPVLSLNNPIMPNGSLLPPPGPASPQTIFPGLNNPTMSNDSLVPAPRAASPQTTFPSIPMASAADPRLRRRASMGSNLAQSSDQAVSPVKSHESLGISGHFNPPRIESPVIRDGSLPGISDAPDAMITQDYGSPPPNEMALSAPGDSHGSLRWLFESSLRMSVDELATLPASKETHDEPIIADMFYLHFPEDESGQAELKLLDAWLKLYDKTIWSNRDPAGWSKFYQNCRCGVVIVHEDRLFDIASLRPAVHKLLWSSKMNFWSIRMAEPLTLFDSRFFHGEAYYQPIFARGGAFLITEDVFQDLRYSAMLVCWFYYHQKGHPGQFKLVLFPGVLASLEKRFDDPSTPDEEKEPLLTLIFWIMRANTVDRAHPTFDMISMDIRFLERANNNILTFEFPGYGTYDENDNLGIPEGLTQLERNALVLVDAFSGWAMMHSSIFKRSIVITTIKNDQLWERWKTWGHIYTCTIKQFFDIHGVSEKQLLERVYKGEMPLPPRSESPSSRDEPPAVNDQLWRAPSHHPDPRQP